MPKPRVIKSLYQCLPVAIESCKNARMRLYKFIRLPFDVIESVAKHYPNLQVIHLLRDPRAMLRSQVKVGKFNWTDVPTKAQEFCSRMSQDLVISQSMHSVNDKNAKILLYENLAENPLDTARSMYKFINKPMYKTLERYIRNLTSVRDITEVGTFGLLKVNSTKNAYTWRDELQFEYIQAVDRACTNVYSVLGYLTFSNEKDARDHTLPTRVIPQPQTLFIWNNGLFPIVNLDHV